MSDKKCSICKEYKNLSCFGKGNDKDGRRYDCKSCHSISSRNYRTNNSERTKERIQKWKKNNPDKVKSSKIKSNLVYRTKNREALLVKKREDYYKNKEKYNQISRDWQKAHPEKKLEYKRNRRALKAKNGGRFTNKEWVNLCATYGNRCLCCNRVDVKLTADHVIPLSKGGSNTIDNIQPLCLSCNDKKMTKSTDYRASTSVV